MDTVLLHGDMLEWVPKLPKESADVIFADLPYGRIKEGKLKNIDRMIPLDQMWDGFRHVLKPTGTLIFTAVQPFTSMLVVSNVKWFRYEMIWRCHQSGFLNCNNRPMREHQNILIFSERAPAYNLQLQNGKPYMSRKETRSTNPNGIYGEYERVDIQNQGSRFPTSIIEGAPVLNPPFRNGPAYKRNGNGNRNASSVITSPKVSHFESHGSPCHPTSILDGPIYNPQMEPGKPYTIHRSQQTVPPTNCYSWHNPPDIINKTTRHPSSVLTFKQARHKNIHPFEKPLGLVEYLLRSYTNPGMKIRL